MYIKQRNGYDKSHYRLYSLYRKDGIKNVVPYLACERTERFRIAMQHDDRTYSLHQIQVQSFYSDERGGIFSSHACSSEASYGANYTCNNGQHINSMREKTN